MQLGVLDRVREIATMPEADLMALTPAEIQTYLNRARRLAREAVKLLEEAPSHSPAFEGILARPPRTAESMALEADVGAFKLSNDLD